MSRNQKAPLLAFVLVALVCGLILVDSIRTDASERQLSVFAPAPLQSPLSRLDRDLQAPATGDQGDASVVPSEAADPSYQLGPASSDESAAADSFGDNPGSDATQDPAWSMGHALGSFSSNSSGPSVTESDGEQGHEPVDPSTGTDDPSGSEGTSDEGQASDGSLGVKDPTAGIANFGPDGGRPEVDPEHPEPINVPCTDAVDPETSLDPVDPVVPAPIDPVDPIDPIDPTDPTDPTAPLGGPDALPSSPECGHQDEADKRNGKRDNGNGKGNRNGQGKK